MAFRRASLCFSRAARSTSAVIVLEDMSVEEERKDERKMATRMRVEC
jgi:hypothetical protein